MNLPLDFSAIHHLEHGAGVDELAADGEELVFYLVLVFHPASKN
jgi:hypothetical protein